MNGVAQDELEHRHHHDTHATPPQPICNVYKRYRRMRDIDVNGDESVIDFERGLTLVQKSMVQAVGMVTAEEIRTACHKLVEIGGHASDGDALRVTDAQACTVYEHLKFPGLRIFPSLLPPSTQLEMVSRLLHRDLANPLHKTNLHDTHHIYYPSTESGILEPSKDKRTKKTTTSNHFDPSFFSLPQTNHEQSISPRLTTGAYKSINIAQFLHRRLRWLTLGAQYDWNMRTYPPRSICASEFPADIAALVASLFPRIKVESGVVLFYSPKDYMPVHRDVSEECDRELCSFSLGCDGVFVLALPDDSEKAQSLPVKELTADKELDCGNPDGFDNHVKIVTIRVRSGDMLQLDGAARWAWHAMPKVLSGTCPSWLEDWPVQGSAKDHPNYRLWKGYMRNKRINLSCRQVWDD